MNYRLCVPEFVIRLKMIAAAMPPGPNREAMEKAIAGVEEHRDVIEQILATTPDDVEEDES